MKDGETEDHHLPATPRGNAHKEGVKGPMPMHHRLRLGETDGSAGDNVQGAGNPSTVPTMTAGGKKTW